MVAGGGGGAVEFLENVALGLLIHTHAGVGNGHMDRVLALPQHHGDLAAVGGEADGVGQEVGPDVLHQLLTAVIFHGIQIALHRQPFFQPVPLLLPDAAAQLLVQTVPRLAGDDLRVFVLGKLQNMGAHGRQTLGLLYHGVRIGPPLLGRQVVVLQELGEAADGDQRRLEFVGEGVHKVHPQQRHAGQLLRHLVEAADVLRHLAPCAPHLHTH